MDRHVNRGVVKLHSRTAPAILVTMPGIDRGALKAAWTVFLFVLAVYLVYLIGKTLVVFALAVFLAQLLGTLVELLERFAPHGITRNRALAIVYLLLIGIIVAVVVPVAARAGEQAVSLAARLPGVLQDDPLARIPLPMWLEDLRPRLTEALRGQLAALDQTLGPMLKDIGSGVLSGLGNVLAAVLIPILSFFFVKDGHLIRRALLSAVKPDQRLLLMEILTDLNQLLARYIQSLVLLSILVFAVYSLFFAATGVPYALFLATVAALLEFIPVAGPLVASLAILLIAGLTGYPYTLWLFLFLIVFRLIQDYVINPFLMSAGVALHPLVVLFGVFAGEQIGGIPVMMPVVRGPRIVITGISALRRA